MNSIVAAHDHSHTDSASMSQEEEKEGIPPVLPVSSSAASGASGGASSASGPAPAVTTVGEPGVSLTQKLDSWQASNLPEEKTYFSCDVSL